VPTSDNPRCIVMKCHDVTLDFPDD
jgi:hypothetical protein